MIQALLADKSYKIERYVIQSNIYENYRDDNDLRNAFFNFVPKVFSGADFKTWYLKGYWADHYIPHSIIREDKIIANVSISKMKILISGKKVRGIQFGTVGTLAKYQNQGMSRLLMTHVLNKYKDSTDIFFLFANDSVLDFYPKFGFKRYHEAIFIANSTVPSPNYSARRLNIQHQADFRLLKDLIQKRQVLTKLFGALDYDFITMWHVLNVFPKNLYYLEPEKAILIASEDRDTLHIWDIISQQPFELSPAIAKIIQTNRIKNINYYFPPDQIAFRFDKVIPSNDSPLFIRGDFPLKHKYFKFPVTAQT